MKKPLTIGLLVVLFLLPIECAFTAFGAIDEAEMWKWSIGDWWKFNVDYMGEMGLLGTETIEVTRDSSEITQFGTTYVCYELKTTGSGTVYGQIYGQGVTGTWTINGTTYYQRSDTSWVKSMYAIDAMYTVATSSVRMKQVIETIYHPPLEANKGFPLTAGKSWAAATTETETTQTTTDGSVDSSTDTSPYTMNFIVIRTESTSVSAGDFDTFVIKGTNPQGSYTWYFSPKAGFDVKVETYDATGSLLMRTELLNYNYAAGKWEFPWILVIGGGVITASAAGLVTYVLYKRRKPQVPPIPQEL